MIQPLQSSHNSCVDSEQFNHTVLTETDFHQLLVEWNRTQAEYPKDKCIHQLFEEQVERSPDAIAVIFESEQLTYRELNTRANQLAHFLQERGVKSEVLVGICLERSIDMIVGLLGILKAGGAYVPLDPAYPSERLNFILEDSCVPVVLTKECLVEKLLPNSLRLVYLDKDRKEIVQQSKENPSSGIASDNLAYVIYTSGSTGKPKGVLIQHRSLVNYITAAISEYRIEKHDRLLQFSSVSFDASAEEIYACLSVGATLVLRNDSMLESVKVFLQRCQDWGITVLFLPTAYWHELTAKLGAGILALPPRLHLVVIGGEKALATRLLDWRKSVSPEVRLVNTYGPTEVTICALMCDLSKQVDETALQEVPIGRPIRNIQAYILSENQKLCSLGEVGELYLGGVGLARGYHNRPELTNEKFVPNPFSDLPEVRLYKTGDRVRYLSDGNIEFLGRYDEQVKIRGFRIEIGEIEAVLAAHPMVEAVAVIDREDTPNEKRLVAYLVHKKDECHSVSVKAMRAYLANYLPEYMIPSAFVTLPTLPLTPNGKIDRRILPVPDLHPELEESFVAPRTPTEEILVGIWSEVLKVNRVGIHNNFLELGGHSLLAIQVISRVRDTLGVELPLRCLFDAPTVAELAQYVETVKQQSLKSLLPSIQPVERTQNLPLSFGQEQLWILHQLAPDVPVYNEPSTIRLPENVDVAALEKALNELVERHEILRTIYQMIDGQPKQTISPSLSIPLSVVDLRALPVSEREAEALRLATEEARLPFDLISGPLLRTTLIQLDETDYRLFLTAHHIIDDGISSYSVFLPELKELYQAFCANQPSPLKNLPIQYADFAVWQRRSLHVEVLKPQIAYWRQQLADLPVLQLPTDRPRTSRRSFRGSRQCLALSKRLTENLKALSQREGVTLFMTLLAAFKTLLYRYTGADDIPVGTVTGSRNSSEVEGLLGFFLNTLVLRTDLSGNPNFLELLDRVREVTLEADAHRDLPFEYLVQTLQVERSSNRNPLFQVSFVLEPPMPSLGSGWNISQLEVDTGTSKFDLTLELDERPEGIIGRIEYSTDLFDVETISRMIVHFQTLLEGIVANPGQQISELPLLTEAERHQLLVEWNNTKTEYPQDKCIHQLFEEQVERTPDAIAVVFEGEQLTYRELNARANQLAHHLQTLGVDSEVLVGICVERSLLMVIGILGILKAGGAYVPLDPAYPQERLAFMLADSAVTVLLTQFQLAERLPVYSAQTVYLDKHWEDIDQQSQENLAQDAKVSNLAYVIYTSGSTGKPKGVLVEHQGVVNLVGWHQQAFAVSPTDRTTQVAGFAFDASTWEIWSCLTAGASLHIVNERIRLSPLQLQDWLLANSITIAFLPTALAERVLALEWSRDAALRVLLTGGDKLQCYSASSIPFKVVNNYGPTENTVVTTSGIIFANNQTEVAPSIGRPITNTQLYILDRHLQPVPVGVSGELYIGGGGLARGYLNRPDLTQEKFVPNPFKNEFGSRLYKTGDLVRYRSDANIEFLGRVDDQVKIRGFRIELGEIEAALIQHPTVQEAVVVVREDVPGDKRLTAYFIDQQATISFRELRDFLKQRLPEYMIPAALVQLDSLPLTPNGKIDRRALPLPSSSSELQQSFVEARTAIEKILVQIWSDVLRLEQVGIHDNFFELGGDSILSIQIVARCNQAGLKLTPKDLFQHQTIAELAQVVSTSAAIQAEQGIVTGIVPLTPIQHWFLQQQLPEPHYFNQSFIFEVSSNLKSDLLRQAIQHLLMHHDALRLRLLPLGDAWQQINVASEEAEFFNVVNLSEATPDEQVAAIEGAATKLQASLNLQSGPILRVTLFKLGANQPSRLLMIIHHLAIDGVSWRILLEDLAIAYQQLDRKEGIVLPAKTTSFQDWATRLTNYAHSEAAAELSYWLDQVDGEIVPLPIDFSLEKVTNTVEDSAEIFVSLTVEQTTALLKEVPSAYNTQINDVLLTALVQSFAQWTGQRSLLLNLEGHGREDLFENVSLARTVGWFTAVFPVVLKLDKPESPEKALKSIKEQLRQIPNHGIGYGILRYLSPGEKTRLKLQTLPQAEVCFNYLGQLDQMSTAFPLLRFAKEAIGLDVSPKQHRSHLLEVNGFVAEGKLQLAWTYNRKLHQQATVEHLAQSFIEALMALIAHCLLPEASGYTPSDFPDVELSQAELDELMQSLNAET